MPLDDKPGFDINRPRDDKLAKSAMLPTFRADQRVPMAFRIDNVDDYVSALHAQLDDTYGKAQNSLAEAAKAMGVAPPQALSYSSMSFMPDPANYGLMQWPGLNPEALRKITRDNITPVVIIRNRVDDLARYSGVSNHPWQPGWRVMMRDPSATPTAQDKTDIKEAQTFIYNCSMDGSRDARERDANLISPFEMFLRSFVDDALTFDGWSIWTDMDSQDRVRAFANLPAGCIRLSLPTRGYKGNRDYFAALVDETGSPVKPFTRREMTWRIRNVRNDPSVYSYGWPESEMAIRLIQSFQSAIDLNADSFCYSEDTEVLTKTGWQFFSEVNIQTDQFATLNLENGAFEYQQATEKTWVDYSGDMYTMKSRCCDFLVSPNHRVVTQYRPDYLVTGRRTYTVQPAQELYAKLKGMKETSRKNYCLPITSDWVGVEIPEQVFAFNPPQYAVTAKAISGDDYCALMGAWLSEGNLTGIAPHAEKNRIVIHQRRHSKGFKPFQQLLERVTGKQTQYYAEAYFTFGWRGLARHMEAHGINCYTKIIPQIILNAPPRQQKIFWDYYVLGDGHTSESTGQEHIATTSKKMADQLQELAQKMGFAATIGKIDATKYTGNINGREIHAKVPRYDIYLKTSPMSSMDMDITAYSGKIGCVTVPNGTLYVRRNGKAAWCGNTKSSIPNGMLLLKGDYFNQEQIDALMREWTNMKRGVSKLWGMPVMSVPEDGDVEVLNFMDMKGQEVRYKDHMNMMMGLCCLVWRFPIRRLGMFVSGNHRDNQPTQDAAIEIQGADDPGLPPLLLHVEETINPYILWTRWPRLRFGFMSKNPKEDARSFSERTKARTWGEARAESDLPKLETIYPSDMKELAQIMSNCPEDPIKAAVYQTVAVKMLEAQLGLSTTGDEKSPGPGMQNQKDPAEAQGHGALGGVRRNSRREKDRAESNSTTPTGATV